MILSYNKNLNSLEQSEKCLMNIYTDLKIKLCLLRTQLCAQDIIATRRNKF